MALVEDQAQKALEAKVASQRSASWQLHRVEDVLSYGVAKHLALVMRWNPLKATWQRPRMLWRRSRAMPGAQLCNFHQQRSSKIKTSQASLDTHPSCIRESEIFKVGLNMLKLGFYKLELSCRSFGKVACIESPKLRNLDTESWKILKPQADTVREKTTEVEQHSAFVSWNIFQSLTTLQFWHGKKLTCRKLWSRANHGQLNCFG